MNQPTVSESCVRRLRAGFLSSTDSSTMVICHPLQVHFSMIGQEAFFSKNMSSKEVIKVLKEQQPEATPAQKNAGTSSQIP